MPHDTPLLATLAAALLVAWVLGLLAQRFKFSPIVGYLVAGLIQCTVATLLGVGIGVAFGWPMVEGLVLGMALSVASTVVLLRGPESHNLLGTPAGHVAIGWLIVEDILTVIVLVVLPALSTGGGEALSAGGLAVAMAIALGKLAVLVGLVFFVGSRAVPRLLVEVARLQSRELFTLTILGITVAIAAGAAAFFGASVALGAFLAGMVVGQTKASQQAAADALPLRDAFAVLFFVSVGMLFQPGFIMEEPWLFLAALGVVLVGFGPVGQAVDRGLRHAGQQTVIIDLNMDTVSEVASKGRLAIYGDATHEVILKAAGIARATQLIVTLPHSVNRAPLVTAVRQLNPNCRIFVRARYLKEREELVQAGAYAACFEEAEAAVALTAGVLTDMGIDAVTIVKEVDRVRAETTGASLATFSPERPA